MARMGSPEEARVFLKVQSRSNYQWLRTSLLHHLEATDDKGFNQGAVLWQNQEYGTYALSWKTKGKGSSKNDERGGRNDEFPRVLQHVKQVWSQGGQLLAEASDSNERDNGVGE